MTLEDHLHDECKILPVRKHCSLLTRQHLIKCEDSSHPNHGSSRSEPTDRARQIKVDYRNEKAAIGHLTSMIGENRMTVKEALSWVHTETVNGALRDRRVNAVLGEHPPSIADSEKSLPRQTRVTLAQLRSGYSKYLNSYLARVNPEIVDVCPQCGCSHHTTRHLFECPLRPTTLTTRSLWTDPIGAAGFLGLDPPE